VVGLTANSASVNVGEVQARIAQSTPGFHLASTVFAKSETVDVFGRHLSLEIGERRKNFTSPFKVNVTLLESRDEENDLIHDADSRGLYDKVVEENANAPTMRSQDLIIDPNQGTTQFNMFYSVGKSESPGAQRHFGHLVIRIQYYDASGAIVETQHVRLMPYDCRG